MLHNLHISNKMYNYVSPTKPMRRMLVPDGVRNSIMLSSYRYVIIEGFPNSKSRNPKSVVLYEFILNTFCPIPGIRGKNEMEI